MKRYANVIFNENMTPKAEAFLVMASWRYSRKHPMVAGAIEVEALRIVSRPEYQRVYA